jgi:hypothetical protein
MKRQWLKTTGMFVIFLLCGLISFVLTTFCGIPTLSSTPRSWRRVKAEIKALPAKPQANEEWIPMKDPLGSDLGALPSEVLWHQRLSGIYGFGDNMAIDVSKLWLSKKIPQFCPSFLISKGVYDAEQWLGVIDPMMTEGMFINMYYPPG